MADEQKDQQPKTGEDAPKRRRSSTRKPAAEKKSPAEGKQAADKKPAEKKPTAGKKPAAEKKPTAKRSARKDEAEKTTSRPARRRAPARAKQGAAAAKAEASEQPSAEEQAKPEETKPARRSGPRPAPRGREAPARPVVVARAKYVRSSARKARLVLDHVRGKSIADARAVLRLSPRGVARDLERLLDSAIANAENNHELVGDDLLVKEVYADEGPTLKRFRPRAQGRAYRVRKRTSHLTMTLTPRE
jgi:ribosomal protein L22